MGRSYLWSAVRAGVLALCWHAGWCQAQEPAQATAAPAVIEVRDVAGVAEVLRSGSRVWDPVVTSPTNVFKLFPGDEFRTGKHSQATLLLQNRSVVSVGDESHVRVGKPDEEGWSLFRGIFRFFQRDKPGSGTVRTPTVVAITRGTEFSIEVAEDQTTLVSVFEGEVELHNGSGDLTLGSGEQGIAELLKGPRKTPVIPTMRTVQWCLYYPGVLDVADLDLSAEARQVLADSMSAYERGDVRGALDHLAMVAEEPASPGERLYRAAVLLANGFVAEAEAGLTRIGDERHRPLAAALRALVDVVTLYQPQDLIAPGSSTEWLAQSYIDQGRSDLRKALGSALESVRVSEGMPDRFGYGWARVAELEFSFGHLREAREALDKALAIAPANAQAVALRGFVMAGANRIGEAKREFERAIDLDGTLANGWLGRGLCSIRQGKLAEAEQDLLVAAAREPQRALLRSYLAKTYGARGNFTRAMKELVLASQLDPKDPTAPLYSAILLEERYRFNEAIHDLERARDLNQNRRVYRSEFLLDQDRAVKSANLARIYQEAGMADVAVREAGKAVSDDYGNYSAHLFLANSYVDADPLSLRFETPRLSEYLVANLLAPVDAGILSPAISQQEYSKLFVRNGGSFVSETEYLSRGAWRQAVAHHGLFGRSSYALEGYYRSDPGERANNDLELGSFSAQFKQQLSDRDTVLVQTIFSEAKSGDLASSYNPEDADSLVRIHERQVPILLLGYHHEWRPGMHTLVSASHVEDTLTVDDPRQRLLRVAKTLAGTVTSVVPFEIEQDYRGETDVSTVEVQQIIQGRADRLVAGVRYQTGGFDTRNAHGTAFGVPAFPTFPPEQFVSSDLTRLSAYAHYRRRFGSTLAVEAGVTYDYLESPRNFRYAPLLEGEESTSRVSPRAGIVWEPIAGSVLRAAYSRSLGGVSFDQSFSLEPTVLAGFNQSFRSMIPESVAGANTAAQFETMNAAFEQRLWHGGFLGLGAEMLSSDVRRDVGIYEYVGFLTRNQSSTLEELDYRERSLTATYHQSLGRHLAAGVRYRFSSVDFRDDYTELAESAPTPGTNFRTRNMREADIHELNLLGRFNHPCGFYAEWEAIWTRQSNQGYIVDQPGDQFWHFDVFAGYRLPRRAADLRIGVLNLTDQDYRLNPLNLSVQRPRERTLALSLRLSF